MYTIVPLLPAYIVYACSTYRDLMKYLVAFRYVVNLVLKGVVIMLTVNINGKKASLWGTLAQMAITGVAVNG